MYTKIILFMYEPYSCNSRKMNQDNFPYEGRYMMTSNDKTEFPIGGSVTSKFSKLFGVFDDMGVEHGEIASFIVAKMASMIRFSCDAMVDLLKLCMDINRKIYRYAENNSTISIGTAATMLAFTIRRIVLCNIGDSTVSFFQEFT